MEDDREAAAELAAVAYLENYEIIEGAVIAAAPEINEELEPLLGADLRAAISEGAEVSEIEAMADRARRAACRCDRRAPAGRGARVRLRALLAATGLLAALALTVGLPAPAHAADVTVEDALTELDEARAGVDEAVGAMHYGDAGHLHGRRIGPRPLHYLEIPLRVRDEGLTLALEEDFAALRNQIEDGAPVRVVRGTGAEVQAGLDDVERALAEPGIAAPVIATVYSFTILFREASRRRSSSHHPRVPGGEREPRLTSGRSCSGPASALVATVATFFLITRRLRDRSGATRAARGASPRSLRWRCSST